jgi:hypothetical protein
MIISNEFHNVLIHITTKKIYIKTFVWCRRYLNYIKVDLQPKLGNITLAVPLVRILTTKPLILIKVRAGGEAGGQTGRREQGQVAQLVYNIVLR